MVCGWMIRLMLDIARLVIRLGMSRLARPDKSLVLLGRSFGLLELEVRRRCPVADAFFWLWELVMLHDYGRRGVFPLLSNFFFYFFLFNLHIGEREWVGDYSVDTLTIPGGEDILTLSI